MNLEHNAGQPEQGVRVAMKGNRMMNRIWLLAILGIAMAYLAQEPAAAQQPAAPQQPAPAQPAAPQQPAETPPLIYSPWNKVCAPEKPDAKPTCLTLIEARAPTGHFLGGVGLVEQEGETTKILRVTLPLAMLNAKGVQLTLDQDKPVAGPFLTCLPSGCLADFEAKPDLVEKLQKGQTLLVKALFLDGSLLSVTLPLTGFAKANAGPPTDPKVIEEQQKKLQEALRPKAEGPAKTPPAPAPQGGN
jgi:invasion protein IalB